MKKQKTKSIFRKHLHVILKSSLLILAFLFTITLGAQQVVNTSGGDNTGVNGSASYSLGQVAYTSCAGTNGSVNEGVLPTYSIEEVSNLDKSEFINVDFRVFPNPTTDKLTLHIDNLELNGLSKFEYQLYNLNGQLMQSGLFDSNERSIDMSDEMHGTYLLKINSNNRTIRTYKVVKN